MSSADAERQAAMKGEALEVGTSSLWWRGLLFSALVVPLLGALLTCVSFLISKGEPPSIFILLVVAVAISYVVTTGPALVAGAIWVALARYWRSQGHARRSIVRRLAFVGIWLGTAGGLVAGSLAEGRLVVGPEYLGAGAATGLLMGLAFPQVLWGAVRHGLSMQNREHP